MLIAWIVLVVAGLLEVLWANLLKRADGFTHKGTLAAGLGVELVSVGMLGWAMQEISLGAGFAAWAAIGTIGSVLVGLVVYGESLSPARLGFLTLLVGGIVGLQFVGTA